MAAKKQHKKQISTRGKKSAKALHKSKTQKPITRAVKTPPKKVHKQHIVPKTQKFATLFAIGAVTILLITTAIWSWLSAKVQQANADQLVNSLLFQNWHTFQGALFPSAHSFILKWPLFLVVQLVGASAIAFQITTVVVTLLTVLCLAAILYRIDRRPLEFGVLILGLASIFTLIPAQPYPGGILPLNMAMIATRNIEYIVYIIAIAAFLKWRRPKHAGFWGACIAWLLLVVSDRLFATISLGGALLASAFYILFKRKQLSKFTLRWLVIAVCTVILSAVILSVVDLSGVTHLTSQSQSGPFAFVFHARQLALGFIFGVLGILTNFGANPVFDAPTFKTMPHALHTHLVQVSGMSFIVNLALFGFALWVSSHLFVQSFTSKKQNDNLVKLSLVLLWSSLASFVAFVVTDHYYFVDARYLTIFLFAFTISVATWLRNKHISPRLLYIISAVLVCSIAVGFVETSKTYQAEMRAMQPTTTRNQTILGLLKQHHIDSVVGDYWRVVPLKAESPDLHIMPLDACTQGRDILSSKEWRVDMRHKPFAYILSFDKSLTNYPNCTLNQIIAMYGQPSMSVLVDGKLDNPKEALLFYDPTGKTHNGKNVPRQTQSQKVISLSDYPNKTCATGPTLMNIVAHQDDDLLFLSPDLIHAIKTGACVRTVYLTAGDAGSNQLYWLSRQRGVEAAYNVMTHNTNPWLEQTVKVDGGQLMTIANPRGNSRYSLVFLHLPDGNVNGQGFRATDYETLSRLLYGAIPDIHTVDGKSGYTLAQLESTLQSLIDTFTVTEIHTQAPFNESTQAPDHNDHTTVGKIAQNTYDLYGDSRWATINYYVGYPVRTVPNNLSSDDITAKFEAFLAYARYDSAVCQSEGQCNGLVYGAYTKHQLTTSEFENAFSARAISR